MSVGATACSVDARIISNQPICRAHVCLRCTLPEFPPSEPGQFVQLLCRPTIDAEPGILDWSGDGFPSPSDPDLRESQPYLRRPFSIADRERGADGAALLSFISRTVGPGTRWLAAQRPGDVLNLTGPLGRGFRIPPVGRPLVLVGGGVGIPPLLYLARRLHEDGHTAVTAIFGATTRDLLPVPLTAEPARDGTPRVCVALPGGAAFPTIVTSDDGSIGQPGLATGALAQQLATALRGRDPLVLACGPEGMLQAVARTTRTRGVECQLCIERNMGCGVGTCLSCIVRARAPERPEGWRWALACTDGPVFARDDLLDYGVHPGS